MLWLVRSMPVCSLMRSCQTSNDSHRPLSLPLAASPSAASTPPLLALPARSMLIPLPSLAAPPRRVVVTSPILLGVFPRVACAHRLSVVIQCSPLSHFSQTINSPFDSIQSTLLIVTWSKWSVLYI